MNVKCPNCGAALVYDAQSGKMKCDYCNSSPDISAVANQERQQPNTMQFHIYACTSCGAELAINGVESATYCAYCGQPTIVFNRISKERRPELIIPFHIHREQAIELIRKRFQKGLFIPKEIRHFKAECLNGIYIPYWLYDLHYYDRQKIQGEKQDGKIKYYEYFLREADCNFCHLTFDASRMLNDTSSQRLEPYDMRGLRPFQAAYMSGFYADCYDVNNVALRELAYSRAKEMFDEQMLASCKSDKKKIVASQPHIRMLKETYAMMPAWFITFPHKNRAYTMMVNGQTGKVIGTVPVSSGKVVVMAIGIFIILLGIFMKLFLMLELGDWNSILGCGIVVVLLALFCVAGGSGNLKGMQDSRELTEASQIKTYAHKRQSGR